MADTSTEPKESVTCIALLAALERGEWLEYLDKPDWRDECMEVELYRWPNGRGQTLHAHGWGSAFWGHDKIAGSILSYPDKWRVKAANAPHEPPR